MTDLNLSAFTSTIENADHILIVTHRDPDGDALGAALAMTQALTQQQHKATFWLADTVSSYYHFLPERDHITPILPSDYDCILFLDCSDRTRVREYKKLKETIPTLNIDHHHDNSHFATWNCVTNHSSVGELLFHIFTQLNWTITAPMATCLYAAITYDTGRFQYSNTTATTIKTAAALIEKGAEHITVNQALFESLGPNAFKLMQTALNHLVIREDAPIAYTVIPYDDTTQNTNDPEEYKPIDLIRQLKGPEVIAVFQERQKREIKISLRSKGCVDVSHFAHQFSGGGHRQAAGIRLENTTMDAAIKQIIEPLCKNTNDQLNNHARRFSFN